MIRRNARYKIERKRRFNESRVDPALEKRANTIYRILKRLGCVVAEPKITTVRTEEIPFPTSAVFEIRGYNEDGFPFIISTADDLVAAETPDVKKLGADESTDYYVDKIIDDFNLTTDEETGAFNITEDLAYEADLFAKVFDDIVMSWDRGSMYHLSKSDRTIILEDEDVNDLKMFLKNFLKKVGKEYNLLQKIIWRHIG